MEKEIREPKKKAASKKLTSAEIRERYKEYVLENGKSPASFFLFAKVLKTSEEEFYEHYNSFGAIEKDIWRTFFESTVAAMEAEKVYEEYSVREKFLSFYYTLIEQLKSNRSYVTWQTGSRKKPELTPYYLQSFKAEFLNWANQLIIEGKDTDEIANRPFISDRYGEAIWLQTMFVIAFWCKDESAQFEKTDAAIEKAVNVAFDLMGRGAVDSILDLAKFLYQSKKPS